MKLSRKHKKLVYKKIKNYNSRLKTHRRKTTVKPTATATTTTTARISAGTSVSTTSRQGKHKSNSSSLLDNEDTTSNSPASPSANYKLPILTHIELIHDKSEPCGDGAATSPTCSGMPNTSQVLFNDYLLVPSRVKFKYLIHTLFDKASFENKAAYKILNGLSAFFCYY
jgi:hypothetical protein